MINLATPTITASKPMSIAGGPIIAPDAWACDRLTVLSVWLPTINPINAPTTPRMMKPINAPPRIHLSMAQAHSSPSMAPNTPVRGSQRRLPRVFLESHVLHT